MKVIIDLIEEIRESIANAEAYLLSVGLLKEDVDLPQKVVPFPKLDSDCISSSILST